MATRVQHTAAVTMQDLKQPSLRLSQSHHAATDSIEAQSARIGTIKKEAEYHEAMHRSIEANFNKQISKNFAPPKKHPRDSAPRVSLAATHPSNYGPQSSQKLMPPPPLPLPSNLRTLKTEQTPPKRLEVTSSISTNSQSTSEASEVAPWRVYTDPMWQTSMEPPDWTTNRTILRCDRRLDPGNVISPTWMIGLPCGGMVEMAHCYPSEDN